VLTYQATKKDGSKIWLESSLRIARDASARPDDIVQVTRDVTARKKLETQLRELSRTGLTGSPNRRAFDDVLSMEWRRAMRESGACLSLAPIDIDHFKKFKTNTDIPPATIAFVSSQALSARRFSVPAILPRALAARNSRFSCPIPMHEVRRSLPSACERR
jgi:hypothetical protein